MINTHTSLLSRKQLCQMIPLRLQTIVRHAEAVDRLRKAMSLWAGFFPEEFRGCTLLSVWSTRTQWIDVMVKFYQRVDNVFFKVDWRLIDLARSNWIEANGSAESEEILALFLKYIPFLPFGFTMTDTFICPPVKLVSNFLHPMPENFDMPVRALVGMIPGIDQEAYTDMFWDNQTSRKAWARVKAIDRHPKVWPEPFRYLPRFADWVLCRTNNTILTSCIDTVYPWPWAVLDDESEWFTWDDHFALINDDWQRAKPIIAAFADFLAWCAAEPEHLTWLIEFFITEGRPETIPGLGSGYSTTHRKTSALSLMNYSGLDLVQKLR